jgi:hypothetical protein
VAAVATVLISRIGEIPGAADPAARGLATANAFHGAFWVMFIVAALGALTAAIFFPRRTTQATEPGLDSAPLSSATPRLADAPDRAAVGAAGDVR